LEGYHATVAVGLHVHTKRRKANNKEGIAGYRDSYAIFVSGDDREVSRTERGRVVNVNDDLFINVSDVEKLNILKKARAAEAKGGGLINIKGTSIK